MSEKQICYKDSNIISIIKLPKNSNKKIMFTPLETSKDNFQNIREEIIINAPEKKRRKSISERLTNNKIELGVINLKKISQIQSMSKFKKNKNDCSDSLIEIKNDSSFYNSNRKTSGVVSKKQVNNSYHKIRDNINEKDSFLLFTKRKLTNINDESLIIHKNLNKDKLDNENNNNNNENNNYDKNLNFNFNPSCLNFLIERNKKKHQSKKSFCSSNLQFNQDEVNSLSNIEEISNFYSYTEKCFEMMYEIEETTDTITHKCTPLSFQFDKIINEKKKKLAIFDLDETLVHCQIKNIEECQFKIEINLPSKKKGKIGINVRPNWKTAINKIKDKYVIVVFTASHKNYAEGVLNFLDPNKFYFPYRLYRNNCTIIKLNGKDIYIKDLTLFQNINLKDIIVIDNSVMSFYYQLNNGVPILPYYNSLRDNELICLSYYLFSIYDYRDLRDANKINFKLELFKIQVFRQLKNEFEENENDDDDTNNLSHNNKNYSVINNYIEDSKKIVKKKKVQFNFSKKLQDSLCDFKKKIFDGKNNISIGRDVTN